MSLSKYVDFLDGVAKSRYFDKLKVLGLAATDDPLSNGSSSKRTTISRVDSSGPWRCGISGTAASALSRKAW